jgi:single-strand DNA-binding protein
MQTNKVTLIGNLAADAEQLNTKNGVKGARFRMATTSHFKNGAGEDAMATDWHNVVIFGGEAERNLELLKKGRLFEVEGRLQTRSYTDKSNVKRYVTSVVADKLTPRAAANAEEIAGK